MVSALGRFVAALVLATPLALGLGGVGRVSACDFFSPGCGPGLVTPAPIPTPAPSFLSCAARGLPSAPPYLESEGYCGVPAPSVWDQVGWFVGSVHGILVLILLVLVALLALVWRRKPL